MNSLNEWCNSNNLLLNVAKCNVMSFYRTRNGVRNDYFIDGVELNRMKAVNDLGVLFDRSVSFKDHCLKVISSGMRMLGFVKRRAHEFSDPYVTKTLFCTFVRPIMEYCSVVWNPHEQIWIQRMESIQKQFLLFALRHLGWNPNSYVLPPYVERLRLIDMETLEKRQHSADSVFVFDLVRRNLDCEKLCVDVNVNPNPRNLRHVRYLVKDFYKTDYARNGPLPRSIRSFNDNFRHFDGAICRETYKS